MTTIAYRRGVLAADTGMYVDGVRSPGTVAKVLRAPSGALIGATGDIVWAHWFRHWVQRDGWAPDNLDGYRDPVKGDGAGVGIVVLCDGQIWEFGEGGGAPTLLAGTGDLFEAWGSGAKFALGAMHAGADARDAVRAALAFDYATHGALCSCHNPSLL